MAGSRRGKDKFKFRKGEHLVQCDLSGFFYYASDTRKTWDGFIVGKDMWEPRHPQDFIDVRADRQYVMDARPPNEDFSSLTYNWLIAGTDDGNFLTFQDGSEILFTFYPNQYIGNE